MESPAPDVSRPTRLFIALGFGAVVAACFWPLVRHPADVLVGTARNGLNDVTGFYIGQRDFPRLCWLRYGQLPLWNPTTCAGAPYLGNPQAAFFYPPSWLFWVFDARGIISWVFVGHHVIAGVGAFGLARALRASRLGAFCAGVAFLASPVLLARTSEGHMGTLGAVTWAPWAFWMYERYRRGESPHGLGLAVSLGLAVLAGHIQEAYYLVLALSLVCLYDAGRLARGGERDRATRLLVRWPLVGLATAGLAMAELIPMAIFAQNSARTVGLFGGISATSSAGPASLVQLFHPFGLGGPENYHGPGSYFWESLCHFGVIPLVLAVIGLAGVRRERSAAGRLAVVGGVAFLFALGGFTPLYPLMHRLVPGVRLFRFPSRALFLPALAVAILAGNGVDLVVSAARDGGARLRRALPVAIVGIAALIALVSVVSRSHSANVLQAPHQPLPWCAAGATFALAAIASIRPRWSLAAAGALVTCVALELAGFGQTILRTVPPGSLRAASEATAWLRANGQGSRVLGRQQAISDREAQRGGVLKVEGYDPIPLTRTLAFMSATGLDDSAIQGLFGINPLNLSSASPALFDLLGVRMAALLKADQPPDRLGWRLVETRRVPELVALRGHAPRVMECRLFENPGALPLGFVVGGVRVLRPGDDFKQALASINPRQEVLLDRDVLAEGPRQRFTPARVVEDTPNRVVLEVETERPGYLVLTDAWYPGWRAAVDTYAATVVPADVAFRAVALPSGGKHRVTFEYHAVGLLPGLAVSALTLLLVVRALLPRGTEPSVVAAIDPGNPC